MVEHFLAREWICHEVQFASWTVAVLKPTENKSKNIEKIGQGLKNKTMAS